MAVVTADWAPSMRRRLAAGNTQRAAAELRTAE